MPNSSRSGLGLICRGGSRGGSFELLRPLRQFFFIFTENFPKNQEKLINNRVKIEEKSIYVEKIVIFSAFYLLINR